MGAAWLLPRIVGLGRATEWLLLGDGIPAETALQTGLVTRLAPRADVLKDAQAVAHRLAKGPSMAYSMTKRMLNSEASMDLSSAIEAEAIAQAVLLRADDHRSFYDAFSKGEEPEFKGR
jgi:enoyl-CoA hydratase/carnithine racemase